jgi:hypothetical protein
MTQFTVLYNMKDGTKSGAFIAHNVAELGMEMTVAWRKGDVMTIICDEE